MMSGFDFTLPFLMILAFSGFLFVIVSLIATMGTKEPIEKVHVLKSVYIYTVSFLTLISTVIGLGMFLYNVLLFNSFPRIAEERMKYELENCQYKNGMNIYPAYDEKGKILDNSANLATPEDKKKCREEKIALAYQESMLASLVLLLVSLPVYAVHYFVLRNKK